MNADRHESQYVSPEIKLSRFGEKTFSSEIFLDQHVLVWFISGEAKIILADKTHVFTSGDVILFPKNRSATFINYPKDGRPFESIVLSLDGRRLQDFYKKHDDDIKATDDRPSIIALRKHALLDSFLASLMPYFEMNDVLPDNIASIKVEEAITILRIIEPRVDVMLADFEEPGKICLSNFMEKNFMFNLPLSKFARLSGRSLSTFRRDFAKVFNTTPQKWLLRKRLEAAHYQLSVKKRKPSDVYFEVGFTNLSHFSNTFKKHYGYNPSDVK